MTGIFSGNAYVTIGSGLGGELTPEQISKAAAMKIVSVSDTAHPAIRAQAHAFRDRIETVLAGYIEQAISSERRRIANILSNSGHQEMAKNIQGL